MLNVLQHKKIGEIAVVVTRYFGATKLGTGGLVRAYSSSVQQVVDELPLTECVEYQNIKLTFNYQYENTVRQILNKLNIDIADSHYTENVEMTIEVPEDKIEKLNTELQNSTSGKIDITELD